MNYKLNDGLKPKALAATFKKTGRVQIRDAMDQKSADALSTSVETMAIWKSVFMEGDNEKSMHGQELNAMTGRRRNELLQRIYTQARDQYQYLRYECPTDEIPNAKDPKALTDADVFFKSDDLRDFLRGVAGTKDGEIENVHARWLQREQCMTDSALAKNLPDCKLWFSMDVTRTWQPHWGGHLNFLDEDGEIAEAWSPGFNRLNVYSGGTRHSISYITPFHNAFCLSICGRLN